MDSLVVAVTLVIWILLFWSRINGLFDIGSLGMVDCAVALA